MTEKESAGRDEQVIREILQHLIDYPDAKDTMEGIYKWWLPEGHTWRRGEVQKALAFLALKGWLIKRAIVPNKEVYGINKGQLEEIRNFVLQSGDSN